jgi:hypothetical protein
MRTAQQICDAVNGEQTSMTNEEVIVLVKDRDHWRDRAKKSEDARRKEWEANKGITKEV